MRAFVTQVVALRLYILTPVCIFLKNVPTSWEFLNCICAQEAVMRAFVMFESLGFESTRKLLQVYRFTCVCIYVHMYTCATHCRDMLQRWRELQRASLPANCFGSEELCIDACMCNTRQQSVAVCCRLQCVADSCRRRLNLQVAVGLYMYMCTNICATLCSSLLQCVAESCREWVSSRKLLHLFGYLCFLCVAHLPLHIFLCVHVVFVSSPQNICMYNTLQYCVAVYCRELQRVSPPADSFHLYGVYFKMIYIYIPSHVIIWNTFIPISKSNDYVYTYGTHPTYIYISVYISIFISISI